LEAPVFSLVPPGRSLWVLQNKKKFPLPASFWRPARYFIAFWGKSSFKEASAGLLFHKLSLNLSKSLNFLSMGGRVI